MSWSLVLRAIRDFEYDDFEYGDDGDVDLPCDFTVAGDPADGVTEEVGIGTLMIST